MIPTVPGTRQEVLLIPGDLREAGGCCPRRGTLMAFGAFSRSSPVLSLINYRDDLGVARVAGKLSNLLLTGGSGTKNFNVFSGSPVPFQIMSGRPSRWQVNSLSRLPGRSWHLGFAC
jgi:hypothetical protein